MSDAVTALIARLDEMPWGAAHRAEAERVVALAAEKGDVDLEFAARMRLTANGVMTSVTELALTNFAWCLAKHKEDPARFVGGPGSGDTIFWHFKWMPGQLLNSPVFDLAQIDETFADFEATYRAAGLPLSALVTARLERGVKLRDAAEAKRWRAELETMPRDNYSSCKACVPSNYVDVDLLAGEDASAADRALAMWRDGRTCAAEPETALAAVLLPLARLGRGDDAAKAYEFVYGECRNDRDDLGNVADCVAFAAATGHEDLAFSLVERHLGWLAHDALSESEHSRAAKAFALALTRFERQGDGDVLVRGSDDPRLSFLLPAVDAPLTVAELAAHLWVAADDLATRFDARNGNDGYTAELAATRALVETTYDVPLENADSEGFRPLLVRAATPSTPLEWLDRASDLRWAVDNERVLEALDRAIPGLEGTELVRAFALQMSAAESVDDDALRGRARDSWLSAILASYGEASADFIRGLGDEPTPDQVSDAIAAHPGVEPSLVARAYVRAAEALVQQPEAGGDAVAAALDLVDKARALLTSPAVAADVAAQAVPSVLAFGAQLLAFLGRAEEALGRLDEAATLAPSRTMRGALADLRAGIAHASGDHEAAVAAYDEAVTLLAAAGHLDYARRTASHAGLVLQEEGNAADAAVRYAYASGLNHPGEAPDPELTWRYSLALVDSGGAEQAAPMLEEILAIETAAGAPVEAIAETHFHLGRAYDGAYDDRAADEYLAAAALFASVGKHGGAAIAGLRAGRELAYHARHQEAQEAYETAMASVAADPDPSLELDLLLGYGASLSAVNDARWVGVMERAVNLAAEAEEPSPLARAAFMRVSMHDDHEDSAQVAALSAEAVGLLLGVGDIDRAGAVVAWTSGALSALGRVDEAVALLEGAASDAATYGAGARIRLGDALISLLKLHDRKDEARRWKSVRKAILAELNREAEPDEDDAND